MLHKVVLLLTVACVALPGVAAAGNGAPVVSPVSEDVVKRLDRIERMLDNQSLLDMYNQLEALKSQVRDLRGQLETQQHLIDEMTQRQKDLYADIDTRLQDIESGTSEERGDEFAVDDSLDVNTDDSAADATAGADDDTVALIDDANADARMAYDKAFDLLKAGEYEQAANAFNQYLQQYPDSEYTDNAHYWLGESYYVTRDFDQAITAYQNLLSSYPDSQKAPHAMLKIGYSQQELGQTEQARTTLQNVRSRYPDSTAASLAGERLQQL